MATDDNNGNVAINPIVLTKVKTVPAHDTVVHWLQEIDGLVTELGSYLQALTPTDRRRTLKLRLGGERYVSLIAETAARYGLTVPGGSAAELLANQALVDELTPVLSRLRGATEVVSDTILRARGDTWRSTTSAYTMLSRMAKNVPSIGTSIAPATEFFARRRKDKSPAVPTEATGSAVVPVTSPSGGDPAKANGAPAPSIALEK